MKGKFNKDKTIKDGYYPIYVHPTGNTNVNIEASVNSMKNLQSFCVCNSLPAGRIAKLQGGYYVLTDNNTWEFLVHSLSAMTFKLLLDNLKNLKQPK